MQKDLVEYLKTYNQKRAHQGLNMNGRTPEQVFKEGLSKNKEVLKSMEKAA